MGPKIVDKKQKQTEIAFAAAQLFGQKGFERVTIDAVAQAAGVGKGTVYAYFKNKDALMHGAFETLIGNIGEQLKASIDFSNPPLVSLRYISDAMVEAMNNMGSLYGFFLEYMLHVNRTQQESTLLIEMVHELRQGINALLEAGVEMGTVRKDLNIAAATAAFIAWFDGAVFHVMVVPKPTLKEMADAYLETFIEGIKHRDGDR